MIEKEFSGYIIREHARALRTGTRASGKNKYLCMFTYVNLAPYDTGL